MAFGGILPIFLPSAGFCDHSGEIPPFFLPSAGFCDHPGEIPPIFLPPDRSLRCAVPGRKGKQTVRPQMCLILRTNCCPSRSCMVAGPGIRFFRPGRTSFPVAGPKIRFPGPGNLYLESKTLGLRPAMSTAAAIFCLQRARCIFLVGDLARQYGAEALVSAIRGQGARGFSTPCPRCSLNLSGPGMNAG